MTDPETRYSRGFAFVEKTNDLEAKKAISDLNGVIGGEADSSGGVSTQARGIGNLFPKLEQF
jgi:RNA recognition motif-containing protein